MPAKAHVPAGQPDPKLAPWPFFADDELAAVAAVLKSGQVNYWTGGEGRAFEAEYAAHCGVKYGLAVANGTVALELALAGLDIGPGDEVVVPARTFIATASAVVMRGANPVVADIDPASQNLTAETVATVFSPRTKAIIAVHLAGWPVDMGPLMQLARDQGVKVIEDCAQAHGAKDRTLPVGGIGDVGCFSFCQDKNITTGGEGGMVVTDDAAAFELMWSLRDHGKNHQRANDTGGSNGFKWLVDSFGTNWRLTELQSAIGRLQLKKLPRWVMQRRANAAILDGMLESLSAVNLARPPAHAFHSFYRYYFMLAPAALKAGWDRDRVCAELEGNGVPAKAGACPDISREAAFKPFRPQAAHPNADSIAALTVALPVHPTLTLGNMAFLAETTRAVITAATR